MMHLTVLSHLKRAREIIESVRPVNRVPAFADALTECEHVIAATGGYPSGILDVETELAVLRQATRYDDVSAHDARGRAHAKAAKMTPAECDRLRVAVLRLERFFAGDSYSKSA